MTIPKLKPLKPEQWMILGVVLVIIAYGGYWAAGMTRRNADLTAPQYQPPPDDPLFASNMGIPVASDGHSRYCLPDQHHAGYVYTPHRYPRSVGGEVTNTIHHGFSTMRVPHVDDVQWIISPPSEVQW